ncbi:type VI secretion system Vgr family protein [Tautonia plasticadhaerens]|uniref:Phage-related baseplate assembly protein n=1 Tax=Tautonia plasticadhaerens TaxID=2527974 RepID=A0A518GW13_9BACT|nr:type VI secretion system tip protein VgrG [Tautonia plasticadhaerens]QDV32782.1 Phage-related baseplate assembly protein [Tautonia plasticadhaerens]
MATNTQTNRFLSVTTPLGEDALLLLGIEGVEGLSQLFSFQLELEAENGTTVPFDRLLGQKVTASLALKDGRRSISGICSRIGQGARSGYFTSFRMEVVPELWLLTRVARSRIFQQKSVPDILREVFAGLSTSIRLQGTFHPRDYCVQYRETDFNFVSRLMEEEGISYFFEHSEGSHTLVLINTPQGHPDLPGGSTVEFEVAEGGERNLDGIYGWEKVQEFRSGKYTLWDHCFELPGKHLDAEKLVMDSVQAGTITHKMKLGNNEKLEIYDFPGEYAQRFDGVDPGGGDRASDVQKIFEDNARTVAIRMQEEAAAGLVIQGSGHCRAMCAGYRFTLKDHFDADGPYVITSVRHSARLGGDYRSESGGEMDYRNSFSCIPAALPFRPRRLTPKPIVQGTQTATVVGPAGEEIFTDKYGRVKAQFHWDREGTRDSSSSCWIRVGSIWAGKNWGGIHIPRIGQEVIVAFEEGDPDCPIIVGSVYNADQMPPYTLPDNKTQSGIKSRSTLQGSPDNFNEIRFEDKKGEEQVYVHAEKDFDRVVENNDTHKIGFEKKDKGDQTVEIFNNQDLTVGAGKTQADDGSQSTTVFNNQVIKVGDPAASGSSQTTTVHKDRTATIETGNETLQVKMGNRDVTIDMGNDALTIKLGNQTTKLNLGKSSTEAMQSIELKVGQSSIKVDQMGVTIKGMMVKVEGTIMTEVKGLMTQVNGTAMLTAKGGITMIN